MKKAIISAIVGLAIAGAAAGCSTASAPGASATHKPAKHLATASPSGVAGIVPAQGLTAAQVAACRSQITTWAGGGKKPGYESLAQLGHVAELVFEQPNTTALAEKDLSEALAIAQHFPPPTCLGTYTNLEGSSATWAALVADIQGAVQNEHAGQVNSADSDLSDAQGAFDGLDTTATDVFGYTGPFPGMN